MKKCLVCGGSCEEVGNRYVCEYCGKSFSESDFEPKRKPQAQASTAGADLGAEIYENNIGGVLEITVRVGRGVGSGSGYLISSDGYAITNSHVVLHGNEVVRQCNVKLCGENVTAQVIAVGARGEGDFCTVRDLALIKLNRVPSGAVPMRFGDYNKLRIGERMFVIGNSLGYGTCITSGIVSDKGRGGLLMYDCSTNPGNSGGPVYNSEGKIIGTHVAGQRVESGEKAQGMNKAIPVSDVEEFLSRCGHRVRILH